MIARLTRWLGGGEAPASGAPTPFDDVAICASALLVEAARIDGEFLVEERRVIHNGLIRHFGLDAGQAAELLAEAERLQNGAVEISRFTRVVKGMSDSERLEIVETLWDVVLADGELHAYEANLLRRVGGLIYVSDRENAEARQRALAKRG